MDEKAEAGPADTGADHTAPVDTIDEGTSSADPAPAHIPTPVLAEASESGGLEGVTPESPTHPAPKEGAAVLKKSSQTISEINARPVPPRGFLARFGRFLWTDLEGNA